MSNNITPTFWNNKRATGVKDHIVINSYNNIPEIWKKSVHKFAKLPAFSNTGHTLSFAEIDKLSDNFASFLQNIIKLKKGTHIAVQLPNSLQSPVTIYGILKAGMVLINTNPLYTAHEMIQQFMHLQVKCLIFMEMFSKQVEETLVKYPIEHLIMTKFADLLPAYKRFLLNYWLKYKYIDKKYLFKTISLNTALKKGAKFPFIQPTISPQDIAALQYTGGTTGKPKAAILTHSNLIANMLQSREFFNETNEFGQSILKKNGGEVVIAALPLYHIYAFTVHLMVMPYIGAHNILVSNPRDIKSFIKLLKKTKFSCFIGIHTLFSALLTNPKFKSCSFKNLVMTLSGGMPLAQSIAQKWQKITGCSISEGYGLTECSPIVCVNPLGNLLQLGTVGLPMPNTELKIIDIHNKKVLPIGQIGELCVKGPQVMAGYWQDQQATNEALCKDWLKTGDIAQIQTNGFVKIIDRIKDMILISGFNVYPQEIENIVMKHEEVKSCVAIGIPDELTGEAIQLHVIPLTESLTVEKVKDHCTKFLTKYKIPKSIILCKSLPTTTIGKISKNLLKKSLTKMQIVN